MAFVFNEEKKCIDPDRDLQLDMRGTSAKGLAVICFHKPGDVTNKKGGYLCVRSQFRDVTEDEKDHFAPHNQINFCEVEQYNSTRVHGRKMHPNDCLIDGYDFDETVEIVNEALIAYMEFLDPLKKYAHEVVWKRGLPQFFAATRGEV